MSTALPWYVLLLPLISAAVIVLAHASFARVSAIISVGAAVIGFIGSLRDFRLTEHDRPATHLDRPQAAALRSRSGWSSMT